MKKKLLTLLIGLSLVAALVVVPLMFVNVTDVVASTKPSEKAAPEVTKAPQKVVKLGFLAALSGPDSAWIIPQLTCIDLWVDQTNAAGGIEVGGEKYKVEVIKIDTENVPAKALEGGKKLVLEDKVAMIMQAQGAEVTATAPFFTANKVVSFVLCPLDIGPDRPFIFATAQNWPLSIPMGLRYVVESSPKSKRVVWVAEDYELSWMGRAFVRGAADILGLDLVYDKPYSIGTMDFAPIADTIMAKKPDIVDPTGAYVETQMLLVKELYLRGFNGFFVNEEWPIAELRSVVPDEYIEDRFIGQVGFIGDPIIHPTGQRLYADWIDRYGPGAPQDIGREFFWIDWAGYTMLLAWEYAVTKAGTFDGQTVRDTLANARDIPHPFGPANWWGKEMYGINQILMLPQYITQIKNIGGTLRDVTVAEYDNIEWFEKDNRTDIFIKYLEDEGVMYYQK